MKRTSTANQNLKFQRLFNTLEPRFTAARFFKTVQQQLAQNAAAHKTRTAHQKSLILAANHRLEHAPAVEIAEPRAKQQAQKVARHALINDDF